MNQTIPSHVTTSDSLATRHRIINAFLDADKAFVSGTDLSAQVGISRTAIWKHIQVLEELGFVFDAVPRLGHHMTHVPDLVLQPLLGRYLETGNKLGRNVVWLRSVASTNALAAQLAREGAVHGTVVTATEQTGGRGRRGKTWFSPAGGLWFSVILSHPFALRRAAELTLLASVAVRRSLMKLTELDVDIKWPNDLLVNGRKICGILAEIRADGESVQHAVTGIGINTNIPPKAFPDEVNPIATSVLAETGQAVLQAELAATILNELEPLYNSLVADESGFLGVIDEWRQACTTLGRSIKVMTPAGLLEGVAESIDNSGVLRLRQVDGRMISIHSGDVLFD